jgi:predicted ABC-type transport system involved in lysophospholipase L1 biosynthesis ATPase subunit
LNWRPAQLSGGERQRVAVVRALINQPRLILADEPTGALDEANAATLTDLLLTLQRESGVALVLVTHHPAQAARMGRTLMLREGTLVTQAA